MSELTIDFFGNQFAQSCALVVVLLTLRVALVYLVKRNRAILTEAQRHWITSVKNSSWLIIFFGLLAIWWPELSEFAISIAAVTLALVIAIKELILCFSGAMLRAGTGAFTIGDWIEIGTHQGEVIDYNMLSTTLQELDKTPNSYSFTGRTIVIPNSLFLSESIRNLNFFKRYVFHRFSITIEPHLNVAAMPQWIINEIDILSTDFIEIARRYNTFIEHRTGVDIAGPEPRVMISTNEYAKSVITVIIFCPTDKAVELEHHITQGVLERVYQTSWKSS
ncbi:mechanosensitive ion channel family protein [Nitrosomonas marina]|uniref:Small-conductance mechanosensitive channel n=1 Tax=Nitrosomonas marina TaxID=917 RepID=A0A1H8EZX8_9PROT|nr:mechanosensitive ion channel domain-containing protein [Nitrosomonas marina]SEN25043.1 Small-conductance mechanosensitive channel [Nitrosomonas marina]